jgi:hypothetical protein
VTDPTGPTTLNYMAKAAEPRRRPSWIVALLLCLPGTICWLTLAEVTVGRQLLPRWLWWVLPPLTPFGATWLFRCWALAVLTAIASLALYFRTRKPWFVWLNLFINCAGLLFTAFVIFLFVRS